MSSSQRQGFRVAILATDGFEQSELTEPNGCSNSPAQKPK